MARGLKPRVVTFLVTWRCNCRCSMCVIPSLAKGRELTVGEISGIFTSIGRLDAVRLSGGEPFLRSDLADIISRIDALSRPHSVIISSNGLLGQRMVSVLQEVPRPERIHIELSLDAVGKAHDDIRGVPGAFTRVMETLAQLTEQRRALCFSLSVSQVIVDRAGFSHYWELRRVLDSAGVPVYPVIAYEPATALYSGPDLITDPAGENRYDEAFRRELDQFLRELKQRPPRGKMTVALAKRYYLSGIRNRIVFGLRHPNPPCTALHRHLRINPDGSVPVCMHNSHTIGDLASQLFCDVWHGENAVRWRQWVARCQGCWAGCEVLPSAVYSGDLVRALWS